MFLGTFAFVVRQFIPDILIRQLIDDRVKLLAKARICQQTELNSLLLCLLQFTEQISPNLVLHFFNYDAAPKIPLELLPLSYMSFDRRFVLSRLRNTFKHAFFEVHAQMVRARPQRAFGNRKLARHLAVVLHFFVSFEQMIVENKGSLVGRQKAQAL